MRLRRRYLPLAAVLGAALAMLPAIASSGSEPTPTIEAVNAGIYSHYWSPSQAAVTAGGVVAIHNPTTVPHGVEWVKGPTTPECTNGVPVGTTEAASGKEWSGTCTFTQAGSYTFYCTVHGPEMTGTITVTIPGAPTATTGEANAVDQTEATLNGTVNRQSKPTTYYFNYGKTASYGGKTSEELVDEVGSGDQPVSALIGSLLPGTTYHYQLIAKNAAGTTVGADRTFTTESVPGAPSATTSQATTLTETEATLQGTVNPNGEATKYFFEWGTSNEYGQTTAELPAGEDHSDHAESAILTGLAPGTIYHFRLVAKNASGTMPGADQMLTTPPLPTPPSPTTPIPPSSTTQPYTTAAPTTTTAATGGFPLGPPIVGRPSLRSTQHGTSVKGSLEVSAAGAGGRLEIDLFAKGASMAKVKPSASVLVGRLVRSSVSAGKVSFVVKLNARARTALRRHHGLPLTVKITLTPTHSPALSTTRSVVLSR